MNGSADHFPTAALTRLALGLCIALPWLNPASGGPTPAVIPLLVSAACSAAILLLLAARPLSADALSRTIAWAWLVAASLSAVIGLVQYFGLAGFMRPWGAAADAGVAYGNLRQRNQLATLLAIGLASWVYLVSLSQMRVAISVALLGLIMAADAATTSRTGLVQLFAVTVAVGAWQWRDRRRVSTGVLAVLPLYGAMSWLMHWLLWRGTGIAVPDVVARIEGPSVGCHSRLVLWENVAELIRMRPWTGWGWGELDFAHFMTAYDGQRFCEILDNAHNLPLHLAVELGVPVAVMVCAAAAWAVWRLQPWRETHAARRMAWLVLMVVGIHSLLEYPLWYGPFQMAVVMAMALLWRRSPSAAAQRPPGAMWRPIVAVSAVLAMAAVSWAGFDYHRVSQLYLNEAERDAAYRKDTVQKVHGSLLFRKQVQFALLSVQPLTLANAAEMHGMALQMLHFSPEPLVVQKAIAAAELLGLGEEASVLKARYALAFPESYTQWTAGQLLPAP